METTRECTNNNHHNHSRYPKKEVPIELFQKSKNVLKTCQDCRNYRNEKGKVRQSKRHEAFQQSVEFGGNLLFCSSEAHIRSGSSYSKEEVPIDLFRKEPGNIKSELFSSCKDCRNYLANNHKDHINKQKIIASENDKFYCINCHKHYETSGRALNKDNTLSVSCIDCKSVEKLLPIKLNEISNIIKIEFIQKYKASCCLCKILYLKDPINNSAIELKTYINNNRLYVDIDGKQYETMDFIKYSDMELELDILQFDHLTEEEQRERGSLLSHEQYIPKKYDVSRARSEASMRLESLKCQLLCARCHVMETVRREEGIILPAGNRKKKLDYTNELKLKGCEICKYQNPDLPRFFDFDHLDPTTKTRNISKIVHESKYTFDELITEISKCRILCHHCHIIHTKTQIDKGIINNKRKT
jgi:hypothetical protein